MRCLGAPAQVAFAFLEVCYGASVPGYPSNGRPRRCLAADAAALPAESGRLTPLIRTAQVLEHPGQDMGSLFVEAAAAQPAAPVLAGGGHVDAMGTGMQQAVAGGDAGEPGCSSDSSKAVSAAHTTGDVSRENEEQRRVLPPLAMDCSRSPNGRSQPAPSDAPEGSCRPSSCRRLRFC